jgi:hypothetical protein
LPGTRGLAELELWSESAVCVSFLRPWAVVTPKRPAAGAERRFQLLAQGEPRGAFFAMVVMELPGFRASRGTNVGLYTSLSRENMELVVVHDEPLATPLASAARHFSPDGK